MFESRVLFCIVFVLSIGLVSGISELSAQTYNLQGQWEIDDPESISCRSRSRWVSDSDLDAVENELRAFNRVSISQSNGRYIFQYTNPNLRVEEEHGQGRRRGPSIRMREFEHRLSYGGKEYNLSVRLYVKVESLNRLSVNIRIRVKVGIVIWCSFDYLKQQ